MQAAMREAAPDLWSVRTAVVRVSPSHPPEARVAPERPEAVPFEPSLGEAAADPDYALEQAEHLAGRPGLEELRASLLLRAGNGFHALARFDAAANALGQAVTLCRRLAEARPYAFLPDLARSLGARGRVLSALGRHGEAARSFREGVESLSPAFQRLPAAFAGLMAGLTKGYVEAAEAAGEEPDWKMLKDLEPRMNADERG